MPGAGIHVRPGIRAWPKRLTRGLAENLARAIWLDPAVQSKFSYRQ
jgi:hypothetical protein